MKHGRLLAKAIETGKIRHSQTDTTTAASGMPTDLQQSSARRLGYAGLIYACGYFFAYFGSQATIWIKAGVFWQMLGNWQSMIAWTAILLSLGLFHLTRCGRFTANQLLNLGLVYEVVGAAGIAIPNFWGVYPDWDPSFFVQGRFIGIPWECIWIAMYPMIAHNSPGRVLIASLLAASVGLVTVLLSRAFGASSPDGTVMFYVRFFLFSNYLCAGLAFLASLVFQRLGRDLRRAREFGSYRLVECLGKGGMGEVWRAEHSMLSRPAAVKLIRPEVLGIDLMMQDAILRRFEREAQATAALQSYNTINLYDFGFTVEGSFYYVMEMLDGLDLESLVERHGPIPPGRVVHLLRQVCHSLAEAHHTGLIHRDIKPANIYACRLGLEYDHVKVLDFGIVKTSQEMQPEATRLTQEGVTTGTPGYIAPEAALGKLNIDGRADLYALGCVGYWLLTGQTVFAEETHLATVLAHVQTEPVPPSERTEITVPPDLEKVVMTCLAKDPADRPQNAIALGELLAGCAAADSWSQQQAEQWWQTHCPRQRRSVSI